MTSSIISINLTIVCMYFVIFLYLFILFFFHTCNLSFIVSIGTNIVQDIASEQIAKKNCKQEYVHIEWYIHCIFIIRENFVHENKTLEIDTYC